MRSVRCQGSLEKKGLLEVQGNVQQDLVSWEFLLIHRAFNFILEVKWEQHREVTISFARCESQVT